MYQIYLFVNMAKKQNNPLECTMIFGTEAVNALYDKGVAAAKRVAKSCDGMVVKKKFNTEAEMCEYFNGIADMDGWNKYAIIDCDGKY